MIELIVGLSINRKILNFLEIFKVTSLSIFRHGARPTLANAADAGHRGRGQYPRFTNYIKYLVLYSTYSGPCNEKLEPLVAVPFAVTVILLLDVDAR